jgi:hypothetical protein
VAKTKAKTKTSKSKNLPPWLQKGKEGEEKEGAKGKAKGKAPPFKKKGKK